MVFIWIASSFNLYLINYSIKNLPGDFFMNQLISSISDIAVAALGGFAYAKMGLRLVQSTFFTVSVIGGLMILILGDSNPALVPFMLSFAKGGVKVTFDICYLANSTIFPAIFAGTAFGLCNFGAKLFTIMSPLLAEADKPLPMIVYSILLVGGIFAAISLKGEPKTSSNTAN